jgi:hypothetical protein
LLPALAVPGASPSPRPHVIKGFFLSKSSFRTSLEGTWFEEAPNHKDSTSITWGCLNPIIAAGLGSDEVMDASYYRTISVSAL